MIRTLLVSDDGEMRNALGETLSDAGHQVHCLPSTIGATKLIQDASIQVVVLELSNPEVDTDKLTRVLHQDRRFTRPGFVIVTRCATDEMQPVAASLGAQTIVHVEQTESDLPEALVRACPRTTASPAPQGVDSIPA